MNLALKYRPSNFDDLVGQDVLVRILRNSFSVGNLNTPLLMVGASGVGKTTCARIVSLCLNCENGPTSSPCGTCATCTSIKNSHNPDVVEMDAASNTSVDDIRVILESSNYLPVSSRFKVYIIDEVHMLSTSAFNALLKTLESPAQHAKFIMATTEVRKVPVTVASRCLRLDLGKLSIKQLYDHLVKISAKENIAHDESSLMLIAENSSGSVRNSLFLLEQALIYSNNKISLQEVRELLGCVDKKILEGIVRDIISNDVKSAIDGFRELCNASTPVIIFEGMQKVVYGLCMYSIDKDFHHGLGEELFTAEKSGSTPFLSRLWQLVLHGIQEIKSSESPEQAGEMLIVRLCYLSDLPSPQKIASSISSKYGDIPPSGGQGRSESLNAGSMSARSRPCFMGAANSPTNAVGGISVLGDKKNNDVNDRGKVYNPDDDEAVVDVVKNFDGASVVSFKSFDV
ncbi:DNA polymerase III subunit tau [Anaplasma phagocytophilum]|nr:DNA polymerase III subunit tau [Anaplasma phagocytophilum]